MSPGHSCHAQVRFRHPVPAGQPPSAAPLQPPGAAWQHGACRSGGEVDLGPWGFRRGGAMEPAATKNQKVGYGPRLTRGAPASDHAPNSKT